MESWIGVLDCNNFFVSCERLFRPDLWQRPVIVLSSNDGCVVARSQEVKDMGIPMGVPYFQVKDTLQKAGTTVFSSHFALYRDISRRVFEAMREELEEVEQYSVDEAFFRVEADNPEYIAVKLREAVERHVGIPVSVGVAKSKTQAKYANDCAKKGSRVFVYDRHSWEKDIKKICLKDIWGVGGKLELRYKQHQLLTVADLLQADQSRVARIFGVAGVRLRHELSGQPVFSLTATRDPQKSIMSSRSFRTETTDVSVLEDAVAYHVRHAAADLRAMDLAALSLRVSIQPSRHGDFMLRGRSKEAVFAAPVNDTLTLIRTAETLLAQMYEPGVPYKKAGVVLSDLRVNSSAQPSLFATDAATAEPAKAAKLMETLDKLNAKAGKELLLVGSRLRSNEWSARVDARSPAYTTRWSDIATVSAK